MGTRLRPGHRAALVAVLGHRRLAAHVPPFLLRSQTLDLSLADLVEGLVLHGLAGKAAVTDESALEAIDRLRQGYAPELIAPDSHRHPEPESP